MPSNDFKLTFTLKQHTPIIHFQHDQKGATLRATELKPKLDRFLIEKLGLHNTDGKPKNEFKSWFIAGQDGALDYKVRVDISEKVEKYIILSFLSKKRVNKWNIDNVKIIPHSLYFAQEEEYKYLFDQQNFPRADQINKLSKMGLMSKEPIRITFTVFNQKLKEAIKDNIAHFFAKENFGTRQNKGFGSFSIENTNIDYDDLLKENFQYIYKITSNNGLANVFGVIKDEYMKLKSGINLYIELPDRTIDRYEKSKLFTYFAKDTNIRWEKRRIKQLINRNLKDSKRLKTSGRANTDPIRDANGTQNWSDGNNNFEYQYIRALLGLSDKFEFMIENSKDKYVVKVSNDTIKRYKSPITIKVYKGNIYFCTNDVDYSFFENESFHFEFYYKDSNSEKRLEITDTEGIGEWNRKKNSLSQPVPTSFNIGDFLHYALINEGKGWIEVQGGNNAAN